MERVLNASWRTWMLAMVLVAAGCGAEGLNDLDDFVDDPGGDFVEPGQDGTPNDPMDPDDPEDPIDDAPYAPVAVTDLRPEVMLMSWGDHTIGGVSPDEVYLGTDDGVLIRYDGEKWRPIDFSAFDREVRSIDDILAFPSGEVFVAAGSGVIMRYDGVEWHQHDVQGVYDFASIWGPSPNDVYAVARNRLAHFDGQEWSIVETGLRYVRWEAIHGTSSSNIVLAGREGEAPWPGVFAHFDGSEWTEIETPPEVGTLRDVFSAGPNHAIAVGPQGVALRFDGESLTKMSFPSNVSVQSLWGTSAYEVFGAAGDHIMRFDGASWSYLEGPEIPEEAQIKRLSSVFGFGGNNLYAVGSGVYHYDGSSWETEIPYADTISDLWASGPEDVLMLGAPSYTFDGDTMTVEDFGAGDPPYLRSAWGNEDYLFAVGSAGTVMLRDDNGWGYMTTNSNANFLDVWGSSEDDVYAIGTDGVVMHFNGQSWGGLPTGTTSQLTSIWGSGKDDVYIGGYDSTMLHFDGERFTPMDIGDEAYISDLIGFDSENIVASYSRGLIHGNGLDVAS